MNHQTDAARAAFAITVAENLIDSEAVLLAHIIAIHGQMDRLFRIFGHEPPERPDLIDQGAAFIEKAREAIALAKAE